MGQEVLSRVQDWSWDPPKGLGLVGRSFGRIETGGDALRKVLDRLGDPPKDPERVDGPSRRFGTDRGTRDGSGDPLDGSEQVGRSSGRSGTGWEVLPGSVTGRETLSGIWDGWRGTSEGLRWVGVIRKVWDKSGDPAGGPARVGGPSQWSWTCWGTVKEVWDWTRDPPKGLGRVGRSFGRSKIGEDVLRKVGDMSGDSPGDPGQVGGPSRRSKMGQGTLY